jgi:hypothetical protein
MKINRGKNWGLWESHAIPTIEGFKSWSHYFTQKGTLSETLDRANILITTGTSNINNLYFIKTVADNKTVTQILSYKDVKRIVKLEQL